METYFNRHAAITVILSRFLPGTRIPAFAGAGVARYPLPRFLLLLTIAGALQAVFFLALGDMVGEKIIPYLKEPRVLTALAVIGVLAGALVCWTRARRRKARM
jgi:membrane protein DedA with SNARE-associated domain